jgi:hypothetical protein
LRRSTTSKDLPILVGKLVPKTDWKENNLKLLQKGIFFNSERFFGYVCDIKEEYRLESNEHWGVVYADRTNVSLMKPVDDTLKFHSVCGSRVVRQKAHAGGILTQEWKLRVTCIVCVCCSCRGEVHDQCPFIDIRNKKEIWASVYKTQ